MLWRSWRVRAAMRMLPEAGASSTARRISDWPGPCSKVCVTVVASPAPPFRATLSLTDSEVTLTAWGKLLQALLRLTGPVLLGLALLALRGRVKR